MGGLRTLALMLWLCTLSADRIDPTGTGDVIAEAETPAVTMALTGFSVDDQSLELSYKIVNASDHDVWICDGIGTIESAHVAHEVYMQHDGRTLVIRRRLEVPQEVFREPTLYEGSYVRLPAGQTRAGSILLSVPVEGHTVFASCGPDDTTATRLVVEIGFCDVDLPRKIRSILEIADKFACVEATDIEDWETFRQYFGGLAISRVFRDFGGFTEYFWKEGSERITLPHLGLILREESCLKIVLDDVSIPYSAY